MKVQLFIEPFIVLRRSDVPCVWVLEAPLGLSYRRYACFYAIEICEILELMDGMDLVDREVYKCVGPLDLTIRRTHTLMFQGEGSVITMSSDWNTLPHRKIAESIRNMQTDLPEEGVPVWPEGQMIKGRFYGNPISIIREEVP